MIRDVITKVEREYMAKALAQTQGHVSRGAALCGISRRAMTAKMTAYRLDKAVFKEKKWR